MPAKLQWVRVDEEVVHVGQYAHLKPRDRPKAACPVCGDQVVMKLGAKVAHHCAHKPDATCAATSMYSCTGRIPVFEKKDTTITAVMNTANSNHDN